MGLGALADRFSFFLPVFALAGIMFFPVKYFLIWNSFHLKTTFSKACDGHNMGLSLLCCQKRRNCGSLFASVFHPFSSWLRHGSRNTRRSLSPPLPLQVVSFSRQGCFFFRFRFCFLYSASSDPGNEVENGFVLFLCWVPIHPPQVRLRHCFEYCCIPFSIFWKDPERAPKSPVRYSALALFICLLMFVLQRRHHFFLSSGGNVPLLIAFDMLLLLWNTLILYISMLRMLFSTIHRHICVLWVSSPEMGPGIETCRLYNPCKPAMLRTLVFFSLPFRVKTAISKAKRTWWAAR